ncbi:MAG TPA: isomerizing glutamine--fructose-6-phosphate transaminase, partial [Dehalococcoidales bacterium]|nr:isomerizing glutamine--fructose-6-phosphate transaminase [Dehalococcoidales bacterium]
MVTKELKGSYALLAIAASEPDTIVAACRRSPLVAGFNEHGTFISSDFISFQAEVNKALFIEDGECVVITADRAVVFDSNGREVNRQPSRVDWKSGEITKGIYDYFMLKEIYEQPEAIELALRQNTETLQQMAQELLKAPQVVFTACGTSRYAALIGRYAFSKIAYKFSEVVMASEFEYFADSVNSNTIVLAVSQSGETADVLDGVKLAKSRGAKVFSIVNFETSTLARMSDRILTLNCGHEIGVAATKSFMAQLTVLYTLAFTMAGTLNEGSRKLLQISKQINSNLKTNGNELIHIAEELKRHKDFYYIARGINFAVAGEGALKLKEIAYVHAEGMPAGELKHGTLALVEKGTPIFAICPHDYTFDEILSNI